MKKTILFFVTLALVTGCATVAYNTSKGNKMKLNSLSIGMSEEQVMNIMGKENITTENMSVTNPYMIKTMQVNKKTYKVLYYITDVLVEDQYIDDDETTPLVFDDNKLIGWGWGFLQKMYS